MKLTKILVASMLLSMPLIPTVSMAAGMQTYAEDNQTAPTHFVLYLNSGESVAFVLEHNPKVVHGVGAISVVDEGTSIEYPLDNVHKYMLEVPTSTDIRNAENNISGVITCKGGDVYLSGFEAGMQVTAVAVNGAVVFDSQTDTNGSLTIRMSQNPNGVYVIKAGNKTFKFIKK